VMVMVRMTKRPQPLAKAFEAALVLLDEEQAALQQRLTELHAERQVLQQALARARNQPPSPWVTVWNVTDDGKLIPERTEVPAIGGPAEEVGDSDGTFTELVADVLAQADRPLSPKDITDRLIEEGISQDGTTQVRGAISYLKRQDRVYAIGRGQWIMLGSPYDLHKRGDMADQAELPTDTETPTADAIGVSGDEDPSLEEGGRQFDPVMATG